MSIILNALSDPQLVSSLLAGKVGVMPTDTVYGLVCSAADASAVARLYQLKSRERKPGTIIAASVDQLVQLGVKARYLKPVEHYWPNSISIVIPFEDNLKVLHAGQYAVAVRIPADADLSQLLQKTGPLLTSSANQPGEPPANTVTEAQKYFAEQVEFYVDGGDLSGRAPSTIIRIVDDAVEVLREGAVKLNEAGEIV